MLIKCKACNVGFYKTEVDENNFFCDSCFRSNFAVNQSIQTTNYNSVIIELQNKIEKQEKMITLLLEKEKKLSQSFISHKSEKRNQVTDIEEVYEQALATLADRYGKRIAYFQSIPIITNITLDKVPQTSANCPIMEDD